MRIRSPIQQKQARLQIIPLIDIMFFLLASFMMVSLQMQKIRALNASLPTATLATSAAKPDMINLWVDRFGQVSVDNKPISLSALSDMLAKRHQANPNIPVYITGAKDATHGSIVFVLDLVKRAGIRHVAIAVSVGVSAAPFSATSPSATAERARTDLDSPAP
jgi:biopolymer transport protein ExbD